MMMFKLLLNVVLLATSVTVVIWGDTAERVFVVVLLNLILALLGYFWSKKEKENPTHASH